MKTAGDIFIKKIRTKAGRAINRYGLIQDGDRLNVAVSGGKDSLSLLEILALRRRDIPIDYQIFATHISIAQVPYEIDREYVASFCGALGVPFHLIEVNIDFDPASGMSPCFQCSWHRRKALFARTTELGCNRLATGHHRDDIVETLLMNMIFQGSISTMPPKMPLFGGEIEIIRPLALLSDREIAEYSKLRGFPEQKKTCPYGNDSKRTAVRSLMREIEAMSPDAFNSIYNSMTNIRSDYLPREE